MCNIKTVNVGVSSNPDLAAPMLFTHVTASHSSIDIPLNTGSTMSSRVSSKTETLYPLEANVLINIKKRRYSCCSR